MTLSNGEKLAEASVVDRRSEQHLLAELRNGDSASFERLVKDYGGRMLVVARRYLLNEDDAQDCVQDAFILAFQRIQDFEGRSSIASWLHRIVVNAALMKIRSSKRRREDSIDANPDSYDSTGHRTVLEPEMTESVEQLQISEESRLSIRSYIDQLPDIARMLILLRDIEGYSTEEVAQMTDMSISSVKTGLHRGRKLLKQKIQRLENVSGSSDLLDGISTDPVI